MNKTRRDEILADNMGLTVTEFRRWRELEVNRLQKREGNRNPLYPGEIARWLGISIDAVRYIIRG
jgi:hypothetical protein